MGEEVKRLLASFKKLCRTHPGAIPDSFSIEKGSGDHHYFTFCLHGDEVGSFPGVLRAAAALLQGDLSFRGKATFTIGNLQAIEAGVRFVETDMNRAFRSGLNFNTEESRAAEILSDLATATTLVDFHQTIEPTLEPFFVYTEDDSAKELARSLRGAGKALILGAEPEEFQTTIIAAGTRLEIPSVTVELSRLGFDEEAEKLTYSMVECLLDASKGEKGALQEYVLSDFIPYKDPRDELNAGYRNFTPVVAGEVLGVRSTGESIVSNRDGVVIFPKYKDENVVNESKKTPDHIAVIATEVG